MGLSVGKGGDRITGRNEIGEDLLQLPENSWTYLNPSFCYLKDAWEKKYGAVFAIKPQDLLVEICSKEQIT